MSESSASGPAAMKPVAEARETLLSAVSAIDETESVPLEKALGRVLAAEVRSTVDVPPSDNSAMDGYAVRSRDLHRPGDSLPVSARIQAGEAPMPLAAGTAARIFTGAVIPAGADAVVMQEKTREVDGFVQLDEPPLAGNNIRRAGEDMRAGEPILPAGIRLRPQELGMLASTGIEALEVVRRLRVAVVSTGDELVAPGRALEPGQIYNSNNPMLRALLDALGCELSLFRHVPDTADATRRALAAAAESADLIVSSGGVSVGDADYVKAAVEQLGRLDLWKIAIKPGKPLAFGRVSETVFIGLPGNPVSAFVTFCLFAAPVIRKLQGRLDHFPTPVRLPAGFSVPAGTREDYLRARPQNGRLQRYPHQGSGVLSSVVWAGGLARVPADTAVAEGNLVEYIGFDELLA